MKIIKLVLENFLSFKENTVIEPLRDITVFIGPNNAGKSNIFKACQFLRGLATGDWTIPFEEVIFDKSGKYFKIELKVELSIDERKSIISKNVDLEKIFESVDLNITPIFKFLRYSTTINQKGCIEERAYTTDEIGEDKLILQRTIKEGQMHYHGCDILGHIIGSGQPIISNLNLNSDVNGAVGMGIFVNGSSAFEYQFSTFLATNLQKIKIYEANRRASARVPGGEHKILAETGENLIGVLNTIQGNKSTEFVRIMDTYRRIIGGIESVNLPPIGNEYTVRLDEHGLKSQTDFSKISTGLHQLMILIVAMEQATQDQILLIEEPEVHLHASSQKRLFRLITKKTKQNQFIIATHSSIFTGINEKTANYLVTRTDGISKINIIDKKEDMKFIKQQLGIRNSDVYGDDYTIFVEGDSEEIAFPIVAKAIGFEKFGNEVNLVNLKGDSKFLKLEMFLEYLKNQDTKVFLIADGDNKIANKVNEYIRMQLIPEKNIKVWEKELEDTFESEILISCMNELAKEKGFEFKLTVGTLEDERKTQQKVTRIINNHLTENNQPELVKPELAKKLAEYIVKQIQNNDKNKTQFEDEVRKIMELVNPINDVESLLDDLKLGKLDKEQTKSLFEQLEGFWKH